jgi:hypothetical protein
MLKRSTGREIYLARRKGLTNLQFTLTINAAPDSWGLQIHKTCMARGRGITEEGFSVVVREPEHMASQERMPGEFPYTLSFTAPAFVRYTRLFVV